MSVDSVRVLFMYGCGFHAFLPEHVCSSFLGPGAVSISCYNHAHAVPDILRRASSLFGRWQHITSRAPQTLFLAPSLSGFVSTTSRFFTMYTSIRLL